MEYAREERRANLPSNTMVKKETFSPMLVLMMLMYPTLLGFIFVARLATFSLLIPTPTVLGVPLSSNTDAGKLLHGATDLWETEGASAMVRTGFAFTSIAVVHVFLVCYLVRGGPSGVSIMETHRNGCVWASVGSIAFWFTTCFLFTYTSMARYGAHGMEWGFATFISIIILLATVATLICAPSDADKVVVGYPPRAMV